MIEKDMLNQVITLKDGRKLGYAEYGSVNGKPVFYFHGHRSSRLEPKIYNIENIKDKIRLIAVDRPGFGLSDFTSNHSFLNWTEDLTELAKSLNINKFSILGGSGGAPFALACAYKIPELISSCGIVAGLGPIKYGIEGMVKNNRMELKYAQKRPKLLKVVFNKFLKYSQKLKEKTIEEVLIKFQKKSKKLPEPDRKIMEDKEKLGIYVNLMTEPFRQGIDGPYHESILFVKPWGFNLEDISPEVKVFSWHGELDTSVPKHMAISVSEAIPNCELKIYLEDAHISTAVNHIEEILIKLIS
jgi:pimeloyl-ACP methyl ester carboxylesterase